MAYLSIWMAQGGSVMAEYVITTAVGTGEKGFAGDGGPANAALLHNTSDMRTRLNI